MNDLNLIDGFGGEISLELIRPEAADRTGGDLDVLHVNQDGHCIAIARDGIAALAAALADMVALLDMEAAQRAESPWEDPEFTIAGMGASLSA